MAIDRRALFQLGILATAGAALDGCYPEAAPRAPGTGGAVDVPHPELAEATVADLTAMLARGTETSFSLVHKYVARIRACNAQGPMLRAVLLDNPEAPADAAARDRERAAGKLRGPLHGIPVLVKDNIDTARIATTCGSQALAGTAPLHDAAVITRLRDAGAIILGKTNLSEWANLRSAPSSSGWSALGGQCRNPYALDRSPSGSSSGSAAAVAASLCAVALGSETDGSIVSPASCNALVGVKPTIGLVSRTGVIPISPSQDTVGPLARTVTDAALLLAAIAGPDPADPVTQTQPARPDYAAALSKDALRGARLGVPRAGFFGVSRPMDELCARALAQLADLGAVLVDPIELSVPPELGPAELEVLETEIKAALAAYLATRGRDTAVRTLADVIAYNRAHADLELARFGQELFEAADKKGDLASKAYIDARALCLRLARSEGIDRAMDAHQLDAIVAGTNGPPWLVDPLSGDAGSTSCATLPAVAGYPHVTVPMGAYRGLPMGLSFFGRAFTEAKLLGYAFAYEQATHLRAPPRFLPTAGA